jgi:hypothetical protein
LLALKLELAFASVVLPFSPFFLFIIATNLYQERA